MWVLVLLWGSALELTWLGGCKWRLDGGLVWGLGQAWELGKVWVLEQELS